MLYIFEDHEAVIKMIIKGRSPTMRHVHWTQRVALDWFLTESTWIAQIQIKYVDTKTNSQTYWQKVISHVCGKYSPSVQYQIFSYQAAPNRCRKECNKEQKKKELWVEPGSAQDLPQSRARLYPVVHSTRFECAGKPAAGGSDQQWRSVKFFSVADRCKIETKCEETCCCRHESGSEFSRKCKESCRWKFGHQSTTRTTRSARTERDKPWRHRSGHVKHSSMHKELTTLGHSLRLTARSGPPRQKWTRLKSNCAGVKPLTDSTNNDIWARIEPGELRTDEGSKIQECRLHVCANCGEIRHLLGHWVRRSANSGHSDRECQRSPTEASQNLQLSGRPRCLAGRPQGRESWPQRARLQNRACSGEIPRPYTKISGPTLTENVAPSGRRVVERLDWGLQPLVEGQIQRRRDNQINPATHTVRRRLWVNASCKGRRDVKMGTHGKCMVGPRPWRMRRHTEDSGGEWASKTLGPGKGASQKGEESSHRQVFSVRPSKFAKYTSTGWRPAQNVTTPSANCAIQEVQSCWRLCKKFSTRHWGEHRRGKFMMPCGLGGAQLGTKPHIERRGGCLG